MFDLSRNHFELFGLPVDFIVDGDALAERYRELQRVVHPDRYASASDQEQRLALQQATQVNEAYETLKDPVKRAQYLLGLKGIDMDAQQETTRDTAFLMEQLQLREELENARNADDPEAVLDELMGRIGTMIRTLVAQMAIQFEEGTPEQLEAARESVRKMQFLNKLHAEAEALEAELEEQL
ncbi:MAG: Fe-S protein assembly co-chaperone HscB [Gammaproteobacteria bacterium]|nr:MAG: Fe-S protein assembly co-chaperone HscB [Gammaproteobacteria bacterium]RTZ76325.1 MAG: Fe-S protein assembly co-chaperone HscB [Gammaproteobacteria bacterium]RTZ78947.1 MAG: Fe-S protein assembly co-chaperone HscB [Gammaproteobacteria bacterium]